MQLHVTPSKWIFSVEWFGVKLFPEQPFYSWFYANYSTLELQTLTWLPIHQDGVQNRDKVY